jgi:hypothetical protein
MKFSLSHLGHTSSYFLRMIQDPQNLSLDQGFSIFVNGIMFSRNLSFYPLDARGTTQMP